MEALDNVANIEHEYDDNDCIIINVYFVETKGPLGLFILLCIMSVLYWGSPPAGGYYMPTIF